MTRGAHQAKTPFLTWAKGAWGSAVIAVTAGLYSIIAGTPPFVPHPPPGTPEPSTTGTIPRIHASPGASDSPIPSKTSTFVKSSPSGSSAPAKSSAQPAVPSPKLSRSAPLLPLPSPPIPLPSLPIIGGLSLRAAPVIAFLYAQLGKPYQYGGTGPKSYDCSGLIVAAFHVVGFKMPRTSEQQSHAGVPVPLSRLVPGDILFWGSPATHSAVYVGGGKFIAAQNPRLGVVMEPLSYDPPAYARRVI